MKYRLNLDLSFNDKKDMDDIIKAVKAVKSKAVTLKAGGMDEEKPRANWHECHHDEGKPCGKVTEIE